MCTLGLGTLANMCAVGLRAVFLLLGTLDSMCTVVFLVVTPWEMADKVVRCPTIETKVVVPTILPLSIGQWAKTCAVNFHRDMTIN